MFNVLITPREWFNSPELQVAWAQTWREPHMQAGLKVLIALGLPQAEPFPVGVDLQTTALHRLAKAEGFFDALRALEKLSKRKAATPDELAPSQGWGSVQLDSPDSSVTPAEPNNNHYP